MKHEPITEETVIWVRRQWNNNLSAAYRLADVSGPHWSEFSGGTQTRANRFYVHAYVMCDAAVEGDA